VTTIKYLYFDCLQQCRGLRLCANVAETHNAAASYNPQALNAGLRHWQLQQVFALSFRTVFIMDFQLPPSLLFSYTKKSCGKRHKESRQFSATLCT